MPEDIRDLAEQNSTLERRMNDARRELAEARSASGDSQAVALLRRAINHCHGNAHRMREQFKNENGEELYVEAMQVVMDIQAYLRTLEKGAKP